MLEPCHTSTSLTTPRSCTCGDDDDHDQRIISNTSYNTGTGANYHDDDDNSSNVHDNNSEKFPQNNQ